MLSENFKVTKLENIYPFENLRPNCFIGNYTFQDLSKSYAFNFTSNQINHIFKQGIKIYFPHLFQYVKYGWMHGG
jgi:hypothetical protein